jgi:hypothetical protein
MRSNELEGFGFRRSYLAYLLGVSPVTITEGSTTKD